MEPFLRLQAASLQDDCSAFNIGLAPAATQKRVDGWPEFSVDVVNAKELEDQSSTYKTRIFNNNDINFSNFFPEWRKICTQLPIPTALLYPSNQPITLEARVVQAVNALEACHRKLGQTDTDPPEAYEQLKSDLANLPTPINRKRRERILKLYSRTKEPTLESRLLSVVESLGAKSCHILTSHQPEEWAHIASRLRNVLSHGLETNTNIEQNVNLLWQVINTTTLAITLQLIQAAGADVENILQKPQNRSLEQANPNNRIDWKLFSSHETFPPLSSVSNDDPPSRPFDRP
ncbi:MULTISPECIES: HEPN domain-containing protein [Kocuria]|uniref:Apea-like HEPN domain-containing protein n=1 Tax=Kocuria subflava TaxID=1736139 RepID=A0A846TXH7_9MICC|nr:hypothetical protein [Kocuria subflava]